MKKILILVCIFLLLIYNKKLSGYSYLGIDYGDVVGYYGTRNLGMGGTSIASAEDYSMLFSNPADGYHFDKKIGVALSINYFHGNEKVMDYETPQSYKSSFSKISLNSFGIYSRPVKSVSVAFGYHPEMDLNYKSEHYIPETTSEKNGIKYIESSGTLNNYSFGISINIEEYGAVGISYSIIKGSQKLEQGIDYYEITGLQDQVTKYSYKYSGAKLNFGLLGKITKTVFGGGYITPSRRIEKKEADKKYTLKFPFSYGVGILIKSLFGYDTQFAFDFVYNSWGNFKIQQPDNEEYTPAGFHNTYEFHTGVEHILIFGKIKVPVRLGYYFQPFYANDAYDRTVFTLGAGLQGYPLPSIKFDFGLEFGKRNFLGDNAYFDNTKFIDETLLNLVLEVKYEVK